jgi:acyl phosphate:glycerol-3-phosphate acyltransferase
MIIVKFIIIAVFAYLIGGIPFGLIYSRWLGKIDITKHGSGNVGGTNVLRILGLGPAALTIVSDVAKAVVAIIFARVVIGNEVLMFGGFPPYTSEINIVADVLAGFMAMLGHNWTIYNKFRGGKGVAVYFGGWILIFPLILTVGVFVLLPTVIITRHMSRASILAALGVVILMIVLTVFYQVSPIYLLYSIIAAAIIVFQHRANIVRLQRGTELKLDDDIFKKHIDPAK